MKKEITILMASLAFQLEASPTVSSVTVTKTSDRLVTVGYTLSEAAIVTVNFATNGVALADELTTALAGDVNRVVGSGERKFFWRSSASAIKAELPDCELSATVKAWSLATPPDYLVIDSRVGEPKMGLRFYPSASALPEGGLKNRKLYAETVIVMRKVPAATVRWRMGSTYSMRAALGHTADAYRLRETPHYETMPGDYYMGIYPLTRGQANQFETTSLSPSADRPLVNCKWTELRGADLGADWPTNRSGKTAHAVDDSSRLGIMRALTGIDDLDLPTAAEWEFAYRAGNGSNFYNGENEVTAAMTATATLYGWDSAHASAVMAVGLLAPNPWGLYDLAGNVHEWCLDWMSVGASRIVRGGCRGTAMDGFAASTASMFNPDGATAEIGFRLVCGADLSELKP